MGPLPIGHTQEDVYQAFSIISTLLRCDDYQAFSIISTLLRSENSLTFSDFHEVLMKILSETVKTIHVKSSHLVRALRRTLGL